MISTAPIFDLPPRSAKMIGTSAAFGYVMTILRLPDLITQGFLEISRTPWVILLLINILLLILGGPMDMAPMIVILTPILLPVCVKLGMDPIQFGLVLIQFLGFAEDAQILLMQGLGEAINDRLARAAAPSCRRRC